MEQGVIHFVDLAAQRERIATELNRAIAQVLSHMRFILGPEVFALEEELACFSGAGHVVSCASGTDALVLILKAFGVGPGDAVLCPSFTFAATAEAIAICGASPVFLDVIPETFNLEPAMIAAGIEAARYSGLRAAGLIAVDLFGQPADYNAIERECRSSNLWLIADAAQSFGAKAHGRNVGTFGMATATSFFPSKPLGCYGDGGAIFTNDADLAAVLRSLRVHGEGVDKYDNVRIGMNGRLDTIQAAVLREKLKIFPDECAERQAIAARYAEGLSTVARVPQVREGSTSIWSCYTIRVDAAERDRLARELAVKGIPTAVYYRKPLHQQPAYRHCPVAGNGLPVSERLAGEVLSLPVHPYLGSDAQDRIIASIRQSLA